MTTRSPKRRDDGEGSIYRTQDGRWRAEVTIGWDRRPDGSKRRIRRVVYGATKAEARDARVELLRRKAAGDLPVGDSVTVGAWMTYWLEAIAPRRCVVKTLEGYAGQVNHWIVPTLGHILLRDLAPEHVEMLHDAMYRGKAWTRANGRAVPAKPLGPASVLQAHRVLSRALKVAMQRGKVARNVATLVDPPSLGRPTARGKHLSATDARKVLATCAGTWDEARWAVGLALGPRPGERLGLLWDEDVDLANGTFRVQRQLQRRRAANGEPGRLELVPYAKGNRQRTPTAIPPQLLRILRAHRKRQLERRLAIGADWIGSDLGDLVFTDQEGRALDPRRDWEDWKALLEAAGVPYVKPHGSRHTSASLMLLLGVDIKVVQEILGHASSTITRDLYQHVAPEMARDAAEAVGDALWGRDSSGG